MIKYNNKTINDWYFDSKNVIKVYKNNAVCYYKIVSGGVTPSQEPCFAVVDDISSYQDREFVDVYDKATEKWYKLNNLNQYEEYGIYGSGRTVCEGSTSRLPQGYTEVEYVGSNGNAYINTGLQLMNTVGNTFSIEGRVWTEYYVTDDGFGYLMSTESTTSPYPGFTWRWNQHLSSVLEFNDVGSSAILSTVDKGDGTSGFTVSSNGTSSTNNNIPFTLFAGLTGTSSSNSAWRFSKSKYYDELKITKNNQVVADYIPCQRDSDSKYGFYDLISESFITSSNSYALIGGNPIAPAYCVTVYNGKLTIDEGYEYEWDGTSWVNLGEVEGETIIIKSPEYLERTSSANGYLPLGETFQENTVIEMDFQMTQAKGNVIIGDYGTNDRDDWRIFLNYDTQINNLLLYDFDTTRANYNTLPIGGWQQRFNLRIGDYYIDNINSGIRLISATKKTGFTRPNQMYLFHMEGAQSSNNIDYGRIYSVKIYQNGTLVKDYIPWTDGNGIYGMWDKVSSQSISSIGNMTGSSNVEEINVGTSIFPKYYAEKDEPENNVVFEDMEEALAYECPWVGMRATIDGELYTFDSNNEWSKVLYYYRVEDVTTSAQGGSGWTVTGSSTYNPDLDYYDDYSVYQESTTSQYKVAKVTIFGYNNFTYYLRSSGYSNNNYVVATNLDEVQTDPTTMVYYDSRAITNTYNFNKAPASVVNLSNYRRVTYNNLDKTVEHTFYVIFYGRTYSSYQGTATLLIPKDQSEENWEQVTFSVSTNVGSAQKNLYIDGNSSTSGGTDNFYYRWIVGLPSRSHSSYTNYSNYNYCPSVTSSTFTSVAGDVRQVDYAYTNTTMKNLQFRLVDGGGNIITTGDTVYYNMSIYNGCGASTYASNIPFPTTRTVTVGGSFYFTNSSDRHYIYGYAPNIQFNTSYYSDNYNTYFDIPYAKLDTEAVTVTYTTYDPNDTETPSFSTNITYPYNGGTTSSITLTSYDVPYTYPYVVSQTNIMFSADSQLFTAGQTSRTVTFTLYPNNRDFSTVADMEAYQYAWEGMVAYVDDTRYKYENGEWVEKAGLPDVPFTVNINAKNYNATTKTFAKTDGQLANTDIVITAGTPVLNDGYVTVSTNTRGVITGYQTYFNRDNNNPNLTIISKQRTDNAYNGHMFANRDSDYNWMYRAYGNKLTLHGTNETGSLAVTSQPVIESVRVSSERTITYNNYTDNTTSSTSNFSYGSTNSGGVALFAGYVANDTEWFSGDFYWIYISQTTLTDEQIQQVIDYNENL